MSFALKSPKLKNMPKISKQILEGVSKGQILISDGERLQKLLEQHTKLVEISELEERLQKLEGKK